ncbi:MAG: hypothetical protein EA370_16350, partial [Wenzhouxiangella sp.]
MGLLLIASLVFGGQAMAKDEQVWVRIFQAESHAIRDHALLAGHSLANYGEMLFGQVDRSTAEALQAQGVTVRISENPFKLTLGEETFDPAQRFPQRLDSPAATAPGWHLVQFQGPVRSQWLSALRDQGVRIAQPIYPFSYVVWVEPDQLSRASQLESVRWMGAWQAEWALQPQQRD